MLKPFSENARKQRQSAPSVAASAPLKPKCFSISDVSISLGEGNVRKKYEFVTIAKQRQLEGLPDIHNFILNKNPKSFTDLIYTTWKLNKAPEQKAREKKERMETVINLIQRDCARDVLMQNSINSYVFADTQRQSSNKGRQNT